MTKDNTDANLEFLEPFRRAARNGQLSRREFMAVCAALGSSAAATSWAPLAWAAAREITLGNNGGDAVKVFGDAWGAPFEKHQHVKVHIDGSGTVPGKIKRMVDNGHVIWDVIDGDGFFALKYKNNYFEPIDYSVVAPDNFFEWNKFKYGAGSYVYSCVLTYDKRRLPGAPHGWADFFDLKKFPGKRALYKWFLGMPEICMLAAGRKPEDVYPIDMDQVVDMVSSLGDNLVLWDTGAMSQQLFFDQEVVMGSLWNTRATALERETHGRVTWNWNQQIITAGVWQIPKGAPNAADAQKFIASTSHPERQLEVLDRMGFGPANPATEKLLDAKQKRLNPTSHLDVGVIRNEQWYAEHYDDALQNWLDSVSYL